MLGAVAPAAQIGPLAAGSDSPKEAEAPAGALLEGDTIPDIFISPSSGAIATHVLSGANGASLGAGLAFGSFAGGTSIAAGDLTGDGIPDIAAGMGPGGGFVQLLDGRSLANLGGGYPFGTAFAGGISLAVGDVNGDGRDDIVTGQASAGGTVSAFNGVNYTPILSIAPFGAGYSGGVRVATGDVDGDGQADIIVGQAAGGVVAIVSGATGTVTATGAPFGAVSGVFVAAGDVTNDGRAEAIVAPGAGNGPVLVFNVATLAVVRSFTPFPAGFAGGVRIAATDLTGDGRVEILTVPGPGITPTLTVYDGATGATTASYPLSTEFQSAGALVAAPAAFGIRFSSATTARFGAGTSASFTVSATGAPPVTAITQTGTLPAGITFTDHGNGTATLAGTAPTGTAGAFPLTFTASNGRSAPVQQAFVLTVGQLPAITSAAAVSFALGVSNTFTITATGAPLPAMSRAGTLPAGISFADNGDGTATLSGTPGAGTTGQFPLTLTATSGVDSATQNFTLTVRDGPVFSSPSSVSFAVGVAGTFTLTTVANPPVTTIQRHGGMPNGLVYTDNGNGTATIAGTAQPGSAGTYSVDFSASNGTQPNGTQSLTITVRLAPAFTSAATTTFAPSAPGTFTVTATGVPAPSLSIAGALPAGVTFTANANGTGQLAGTTSGPPGTYPLTITATNGPETTAVQSFTLVVSGPPAFTSATVTTFVAGSAGSFLVRAEGGPAPAISLSGTLPAGVTFADHGNGTATLSGTPGAATGGAFPLTLTATNGVGAPATQHFTLTVNSAPAFTSANATVFALDTPSSFTVTTSAFPNATLSLTSGTLPSGITFTANGNGTATIAGTSNAATGAYAVALQATNGVGAAATQTFTLTLDTCTVVTVQPDAGALPAATYNAPYSQTITATGGSGHSFAVTSGALPPGLTLATSGAVTGSPTTTGSFAFTVTATSSHACTGSAAYSLAVAPNAENETYDGGVGNTQYSVGAGTPSTPAVVMTGTVLSNDRGPGTLAAGPASIASSGGGQVTMAATGSFLYTPAAGFAGPSDTFIYTLTDGNGVTDSAVVTIEMSGVVWYVDAAAGAGGSGRSQSPFNTMSAAATAAQIGQTIYVHPGSPTGATALKANQRLQGAAESFVLRGLTIAAAAAPTLQGTITLADGVLLRAFNVNAGAGTSITGTGLSGTETLTAVSVTGGASGLSLTNMAGTFTMDGGAISGVGSGGGVTIAGGTGTIAIGAAITTTAGRSVSVQNRTAGTVSFSGAITDSSLGLLLHANTGATIAFSGGLALTTGTNQAFTATGGGTVTATQNNASIVNTLAATTATALNVSNTEIGAAGLTFRSISSAGGTGAGIILDNTGIGPSNGGLTIEGNGTANSGGGVTGKGGADGLVTEGVGIYLNGTRNPTFKRLLMQSFGNSAIVGRNVAGDFLLEDSSINNSGSAAGVFEGGVVFGLPHPGGINGLQGTATIRNTTIAGGTGTEHNVALYGQSGSMNLRIERTTANPADCKVELNSSTIGGDGVHVLLEGTATGTVAVSNCVVRGNREAGIDATALGSANLTLSVTGNSIGRSGQGERGVVATNGDDATISAVITGNNFFDLSGPAATVGQVAGGASALSLLKGTFSSNIVGTGSAAAPSTANSVLATLGSSPGSAARARLLIADNFIEHYGLQPAVLVEAADGASSPEVDVTLTLNHVDMMSVSGSNGPLGLVVRSIQAPAASLCANISPNTFHWIPIDNGTGGGISLQQGAGSMVALERGSQALGTAAADVLAANNGPYDSLPGSTTSVSGTVTVVENAACLVPAS